MRIGINKQMHILACRVVHITKILFVSYVNYLIFFPTSVKIKINFNYLFRRILSAPFEATYIRVFPCLRRKILEWNLIIRIFRHLPIFRLYPGRTVTTGLLTDVEIRDKSNLVNSDAMFFTNHFIHMPVRPFFYHCLHYSRVHGRL